MNQVYMNLIGMAHAAMCLICIIYVWGRNVADVMLWLFLTDV